MLFVVFKLVDSFISCFVFFTLNLVIILKVAAKDG